MKDYLAESIIAMSWKRLFCLLPCFPQELPCHHVLLMTMSCLVQRTKWRRLRLWSVILKKMQKALLREHLILMAVMAMRLSGPKVTSLVSILWEAIRFLSRFQKELARRPHSLTAEHGHCVAHTSMQPIILSARTTTLSRKQPYQSAI